MKSIMHYLKNPRLAGLGIIQRTSSLWPDRIYLQLKHFFQLGEKLNLDNPITFTDKLNWLKLYDRKPLYTLIVDKYKVKKYVSDKVGSDFVVPLLGVWDNFDEIDFDKLPSQFVLKTNHDSGGVVICKDKATFDVEKARSVIERSMNSNFYNFNREWPYKNVPKKVIAEKYIDSLGKPDSIEYKLTCFNGKVKIITICTGIAHSTYAARKNDNYDRNLNLMPWYAFYENSGKKPNFPEQLSKMIEIAEILSEEIPTVRVDFFLHDNHVYFGEMTFYTWGGFIEFTPPEWNAILGSWVTLPNKAKR